MAVDQNIVQYIKECEKLSIAKDEIRKNLLATGWTEAAVQEGFDFLYPTVAATNNTPQSTAAIVNAIPVNEVPQQSSQVTTVSTTPLVFSGIEKYFMWIGLGTIILSAVIFFVGYNQQLPTAFATYVALYELIMSIIAAGLLFMLTKRANPQSNTIGKALFFSGTLALALSLVQLLSLTQLPSIITSLLSLGIFIGSFVWLSKLYALPTGKTLKIGIINIILTVIIGVILALVFTITGLFSISSLFQNSGTLEPTTIESFSPQDSINATQDIPTNLENQ